MPAGACERNVRGINDGSCPLLSHVKGPHAGWRQLQLSLHQMDGFTCTALKHVHERLVSLRCAIGCSDAAGTFSVPQALSKVPLC